MSYQVLARKWRPKNFEEVVGQKHVTQSLINALNQQRLHHAYLFTGTRGIGKTTLARIFAKCLNCETGITSTPCGKCSACLEIDSGRFIDLIEVDAASRTKVEDTRELLDNVQYAPTRGRFKIYLIDEVHMLSGHSFNALLKTLEEPPEHVKFLLATTDPQKLPITVLSRCLQFNLKCLAPEIIAEQLNYILTQENIKFEQPALQKLAVAANGSVRDGLSLLDQAIAFGNNKVTLADVNSMLGAIENTYILSLLEELAAKNASNILKTIAELNEQAADFALVLEEFIALLHQIALTQMTGEPLNTGFYTPEQISNLSKLFSPEDIQLFYQIALIGRRDLPYANSPKHGFEMIMLRMLAFSPEAEPTTKTAPATKTKPIPKPTPSTSMQWHEIVPQLDIAGPTKSLIDHCSMEKFADDHLQLSLHEKHGPMLNSKHKDRLQAALENLFNKPIKVTINTATTISETPMDKKVQAANLKQQQAQQAIKQDDNVQEIINSFDATLIEDSITSN